jgi:surfeit locus 1 family protein
MKISTLFRRPWIFVTILVLIASAVMIRLGIWQLDRLAGRRAFNAQVLSQIDEQLLPLTPDVLSGDIESLEFRAVKVEGEYDLENTLVLGNQVWEDQVGVHLLTPLKIAGTGAVILVDRGWIPFEDWQNRNLAAYDAAGSVEVEGMLRVSQSKLGLRDCLDETAGETPYQVWCLALDGISQYLPYNLLSVYLIQAPASVQIAPPYRAIPQIEISEGPHLSYAIQWFTFTAILLIGYPFFVRRELQARESKARQEAGEVSEHVPDGEYHGWADHLDDRQKAAYKMDDE